MTVTSKLLKRTVHGTFNANHQLLTGDASYPSGGYPVGDGTQAGGGYNVFGLGGIHLRGGVTNDGKLENYNIVFANWQLFTAVGTEVTTGADVSATSVPLALINLDLGRLRYMATSGVAWPIGNLRLAVRLPAGPASYAQATGIPVTPATYGLRQISAVFVPAYAEFGAYLCRWDKANSCLRAYTAVGTEATDGTNLSGVYIAQIALGR